MKSPNWYALIRFSNLSVRLYLGLFEQFTILEKKFCRCPQIWNFWNLVNSLFVKCFPTLMISWICKAVHTCTLILTTTRFSFVAKWTCALEASIQLSAGSSVHARVRFTFCSQHCTIKSNGDRRKSRLWNGNNDDKNRERRLRALKRN